MFLQSNKSQTTFLEAPSNFNSSEDTSTHQGGGLREPTPPKSIQDPNFQTPSSKRQTRSTDMLTPFPLGLQVQASSQRRALRHELACGESLQSKSEHPKPQTSYSLHRSSLFLGNLIGSERESLLTLQDQADCFSTPNPKPTTLYATRTS